MTSHNSLKRRVRARMSKSGESYSTARRAVLAAGLLEPEKRVSSLTVVLTQPKTRSGNLIADVSALFEHAKNVPKCDVLVLPELIGNDSDQSTYEQTIRSLAREHHCHVVGGTCYLPGKDGVVNSGIVVDPRGELVCRYEKIRPYGSENHTGVLGGTEVGSFELGGRTFSVLVCSDLWFSENVASLADKPDVFLIPSFSITQRGEPAKARRLWEHMLVSRAYEHSAYVGVCDWAHPCEFEGLPAAGVSGFADPRPNGESFFEGNLERTFHKYELDFDRLDSFRENRANRGFSSHSGE